MTVRIRTFCRSIFTVWLCCLATAAISYEWCHDRAPEHFSLRHTEGKGLGYSTGYTSLDLFLSLPSRQLQIAPFADVSGHVFNDGKLAFNTGVGLRSFNPCTGRVFGINCFYDGLQTSHHFYHQVGVGLEALTDSWEVRVNGYLPIGKKKTSIYAFEYRDLAPNAFLMRASERLAMCGVDSEIGYHFCRLHCFNVYVGLGPYYYWGRTAKTENVFHNGRRQAIGGRVRGNISVLNNLALEGTGTYDTQFKWGGQIVVTLTLPFDLTYGGRCNSLEEKLFQPVYRNDMIVVDRINRFSSNPEILNPLNPPRN